MSTAPAPRSTNSASAGPRGSTEPRLWTPPLRELTPTTSYGFDVVTFAREVLETPLDPWQEWLVIHAGEMLDDGRPRFRTVLALVSRQAGKTFLVTVLALYWLHVERHRLVLGTSTSREVAKESWRSAIHMAQDSPYLREEVGDVRQVIGDETYTTTDGCRYKIAASTRRGGRGLTINRLIIDELREHRSWDAWNAAVPATNAVPDAQVWTISNQGDDSSVVLDALRTPALQYIETGKGDPRLGIFEWSAPPGADPTDLGALGQANPNLGRRTDPDVLLGAAVRAKAAGGEELASFRTEMMTQRVHLLDPAIDPDRWDASGTDQPVDLAAHRDRVALCVDVSLDGSHATLVAAASLDGKVHLEVVAAWDGYGCTRRLREELPDLVAQVKPRALAWFPAGPAAAVAADLEDRKANRLWPPRGVSVAEIRGEVTAVCMGFSDLVTAGQVVHPRDPLLTAHVHASQRLRRGEAWTFTRRGASAIDASYAAAGAVHLARTLPPPRPALTAPMRRCG